MTTANATSGVYSQTGPTGWLQADGSPVTLKPITIQIDVPAQPIAGSTDVAAVFSRLLAINWGAVLGAAIQLVLAMMTGNSAAMAAAIQALIVAIMGG